MLNWSPKASIIWFYKTKQTWRSWWRYWSKRHYRFSCQRWFSAREPRWRLTLKIKCNRPFGQPGNTTQSKRRNWAKLRKSENGKRNQRSRTVRLTKMMFYKHRKCRWPKWKEWIRNGWNHRVWKHSTMPIQLICIFITSKRPLLQRRRRTRDCRLCRRSCSLGKTCNGELTKKKTFCSQSPKNP